MTTLIVDASVAVKWFVPEERSAHAEALLAADVVLVAPSLIRTEVASAFAKKARAGLVTVQHAAEYVEALPSYLGRVIDHHDFLPESIALSRELDHSISDCIYLETARLAEAVLVTDDRRLIAKLSGRPLERLATHLGDVAT